MDFLLHCFPLLVESTVFKTKVQKFVKNEKLLLF